MKNKFKFGVIYEHKLRPTNYQQFTQEDSLGVLRYAAGVYRTFAQSFDPQTNYDADTFPAALHQAFEDYKQNFQANRHRPYDKNDKTIISRFVQFYLYGNGQLSVFGHGGVQLGYLRQGKAYSFTNEVFQCQKGDILFINLEAQPSFEPEILYNALLKGNDKKAEECLFPVVFVEIEVSSNGISVSSDSESNGKVPKSEKLEELEHVQKTIPDDPNITPTVQVQTDPKKNVKYGLGLLMTVLLIGGAFIWWRMASTNTDSSSLIDSTAVAEDTLSAFGDVTSLVNQSNFPKTDSLLAIFYQSNPRTLESLDRIIEVFKNEEGNEPALALNKRKELEDEQKTLLLVLLEPIDVILNNAENAYRQGQLEVYQDLISEADDLFGDAIEPQWEQTSVVQERFSRLQRIKSYDKDPDINQPK